MLNNSLSSNIHILTLEHWRNNQILLRVEHIFEKNEDRFLSLPEKVNLDVSTCVLLFVILFARETKIYFLNIIGKHFRINIYIDGFFYRCYHGIRVN